MNELKEEIEEARVRVAHFRGKAERPGARLEDDFALEKARTRLLTLELRLLKLAQSRNTGQRTAKATVMRRDRCSGRSTGNGPIQGSRTKRKQISITTREKAEEAFAQLQSSKPEPVNETVKQEGS